MVTNHRSAWTASSPCKRRGTVGWRRHPASVTRRGRGEPGAAPPFSGSACGLSPGPFELLWSRSGDGGAASGLEPGKRLGTGGGMPVGLPVLSIRGGQDPAGFLGAPSLCAPFLRVFTGGVHVRVGVMPSTERGAVPLETWLSDASCLGWRFRGLLE